MKKFITLFLISYSIITFSQEISKKYVFIDVNSVNERVYIKGYQSVKLFEDLGHYYYVNNDTTKALLYYKILFKKYKLIEISERSKKEFDSLKFNIKIKNKK